MHLETFMETQTYNYKVVRQFAIMTVVWGIVGMLVGVIAAAQLRWPELNLSEIAPWFHFGRIRPLHTNAVIFAFGGSGLFATSYYVVQRTCNTRLFGGWLPAFTFWGWQLVIVLAAITSHPQSPLARHADIHITAAVSREACPLGLAPTSSTTAVMALGDALAVALLRARSFTREDFALSHPAGRLGKRLLLRVADLMHSGDNSPAVTEDTPLKDAVVIMSEKGLGMLAVTDQRGRLKGILTDGDLRRLFQKCETFAGLTVNDVMHPNPKSIASDRLATEALKEMQQNHVNGLLVVEGDGILVGALNMHDLLAARIL